MTPLLLSDAMGDEADVTKLLHLSTRYQMLDHESVLEEGDTISAAKVPPRPAPPPSPRRLRPVACSSFRTGVTACL